MRLEKSFGPQRIWDDVTFDLPAGEVSVLLGPSGTGKSVFLKSLIGLLRPEREIEGVRPQIQATPGMPERQAVGRRQARVREIMHTLPPAAQEAIRDDLEGTHKYAAHEFGGERAVHHPAVDDDAPTGRIPVGRGPSNERTG